MKLFAHYTYSSLSNSYLVGPDEGGDAILIDAGLFNIPLLRLIENNGYTITSILITHAHEAHTGAIQTIMKIYDPTIYAANPNVENFPTKVTGEGNTLKLGDFTFNVYNIPGHSPDSLVYRLDRYIFTGDTLLAGSIGRTQDEISQSLLISSIREKILTFDDEHLIFPSHGPPSKLGVERRVNPALSKGIP